MYLDFVSINHQFGQRPYPIKTIHLDYFIPCSQHTMTSSITTITITTHTTLQEQSLQRDQPVQLEGNQIADPIVPLGAERGGVRGCGSGRGMLTPGGAPPGFSTHDQLRTGHVGGHVTSSYTPHDCGSDTRPMGRGGGAVIQCKLHP